MGKILRNIAPYWKSVILIILLLIVQATCSLSLPEYTSKIIDTGIQNKGIEHILPERISHQDYEYTKLFMTEEEKSDFTQCYKAGEKYYTRTENNEKSLDRLDKKLLVPIMMNYSVSSVSQQDLVQMMTSIPQNSNSDKPALSVGENGRIDLRPVFAIMSETDPEFINNYRVTIEKQMDTMGYDLLKSSGIAFAIECNRECGVNLDKIQTDYLWMSGFKMLLVAVLLTCASISVGFFASRIGAKIGRDLRYGVFKKVVSFSNKEIDQFSTASLITRSTNDIQQIQMVTTMLLRLALFAPVISTGAIIKVMNTGAHMAWVIVLAVLVIAGAVLLLISIAMPKFKIMQKLVDNVNLVAHEILTGIPVIRAFKREEHEEQRFDKANTLLTKTTLFTNRVMTFMAPIMMFVMYGTSILIVWVAAGHIDKGNMQVGEMTAFITYAMHIVTSFLVLTMMSIMIPRAAVAAGRIDEVLKTESSIIDPEQPEQFTADKGVVEFKNVSFKYPGADENVIENISFVAKPGETTAIIGSTGSGKSTLVNLIPRLYDVSEGSITIDSCDIRKAEMKSLRNAIGYVPQKGILFSGTIESNIKYGNRNASDEEMKKAAEIAQATEFIESKKLQYQSEIAQGGTNVSGGQKQRLAIARAIAKHPRIYIFDDSFSALDMKTDAILREALAEHVKDSTVIIVAQRISTIIDADKIIVLDEGKIAGIGTHKELLSNCEIYLEIAKSQLSAKELGLSQEVANNE